ncbi:hypothetical protein [Enterococcus sp. AZ126]
MGDSFIQNQCSACGGAIADPSVKNVLIVGHHKIVFKRCLMKKIKI